MRPAGMNEISIPWFSPEMGRREQEQVAAVIASNYINDGSVTREFEQRIAERVGCRYCVAVTSGTAAISLALLGTRDRSGRRGLGTGFNFRRYRKRSPHDRRAGEARRNRTTPFYH